MDNHPLLIDRHLIDEWLHSVYGVLIPFDLDAMSPDQLVDLDTLAQTNRISQQLMDDSIAHLRQRQAEMQAEEQLLMSKLRFIGISPTDLSQSGATSLHSLVALCSDLNSSSCDEEKSVILSPEPLLLIPSPPYFLGSHFSKVF